MQDAFSRNSDFDLDIDDKRHQSLTSMSTCLLLKYFLQVPTDMKQISVFGCGAMGTNIANLLAENVARLDDYKKTILWFVRDEECFGERLIDVINGNRENPKYAPNVHLKDNIEANGDAAAVASASDVIFFVYATRHGLLMTETTETVPDQVIRLVSEEILRVTKSPCVVVSGGVNAKGLANGDFAEATIGCPNPERAEEAKLLLQVKYPTTSSHSATVTALSYFSTPVVGL
ncbi:unnamed protein product [Dibothriocephalus latus]|uniref:Glycerol-3-phosphate dehydrogenase NAD-dependent N-terminal domain-containing protein n=1 Tax=Dibothriocephalus latus TaxID=60516 RepID=A0A3P7L739_DIBLA|nr:unnamed protein product [Dibothriocephalus latus]